MWLRQSNNSVTRPERGFDIWNYATNWQLHPGSETWNGRKYVHLEINKIRYIYSLSLREGPVSARTSIFVPYDQTEITSMNIKMDDGSPRSCHFGNALSFLFLSSCWISGNHESTLHIAIYMVSLFTFTLLWARKTRYQEKLLSRLAAWGRTVTECGWCNKITIDSGHLRGAGRDGHGDRWTGTFKARSVHMCSSFRNSL